MAATRCKGLARECCYGGNDMAGSKSGRARKRPRARRAPRAPSTTSEAETRLLALARELSASTTTDTAAALRLLAGAHAPDAPLPRAVARAWIRGREDKTAALALAWAREQVRLALEEILARTPPRGALTGSADTRAWLLLAA